MPVAKAAPLGVGCFYFQTVRRGKKKVASLWTHLTSVFRPGQIVGTLGQVSWCNGNSTLLWYALREVEPGSGGGVWQEYTCSKSTL